MQLNGITLNSQMAYNVLNTALGQLGLTSVCNI